MTQKDTIMNDCEKRLVRSLKEKEQEVILLQKTLDILEGERKDQSSKIEFLERVNDERN